MSLLGYRIRSWSLLDADQDIVCDACGKKVPDGVFALTAHGYSPQSFCCYTAECITKHPLNAGIDSIKIDDTQARIVMHKTRMVRLYGLDYWNRNKMIPIGYEEFEKNYEVSL